MLRETQLNWHAEDGTQLFAREWMPEGPETGAGTRAAASAEAGAGADAAEARSRAAASIQAGKGDDALNAVVCLVHGMGEHSGRYAHVAERLTAVGFAVLAYDQRGHGRSAGKRGHAPSYAALMGEVALLLAQARNRHPKAPIFLYGHSMGGNLALNYALRHAQQRVSAAGDGPTAQASAADVAGGGLAGLVVTSPWLRLAFAPSSAKLWLGRLVGRIWPSLLLSSGLVPADVARDEEIVRAYVGDPLVHDRISAGLFSVISESGEWALKHAAELKVPLLLVHGGSDRITSQAASREFVERASAAGAAHTDGLPRCRFVPHEAGYHELHHEPEPERGRILELIVRWLEERAAECALLVDDVPESAERSIEVIKSFQMEGETSGETE